MSNHSICISMVSTGVIYLFILIDFLEARIVAPETRGHDPKKKCMYFQVTQFSPSISIFTSNMNQK